MPDTPLHYKTLSEVASLIEKKQLSPVELTEAMLKRIDSLDGKYKSYATVMADNALALAKAAESEIAAGRYLGPLHGVPIAVKDLCFTKGVRTMAGTKVLRDFVPDFDGTVVQKLAAAGSVLLGKLNLTEGAMAGYNPEFDIPRNPWNIERWSGASSSGSGVATAAGLCYGSLGSDTGGSIRFPSAACGIVGIKPTWGRVSRYGVLALAESLDHVGPMTRSAVDAGIVLQAIAGHDLNDPTSLHSSVPNMLEGVGQGVKGIRIGLDERYNSEDVDAQLTQAVLAGARVMEGLGAQIVPVKMPQTKKYCDAWSTLCAAEALAAHSSHFPSRSDEYGPWFRNWLEKGVGVSGVQYANAYFQRLACNGLVADVFSEIDVLVSPSMPGPAHPVTPEELYGPMGDDNLHWLNFTMPFDFNGAPTISLPCGLNDEGLPLSIQFIGKHQAEPLLVRVGHAFETATEWHQLRPNV